MSKTSKNREEVIHAYRERASRYDLTVRLFDVFSVFGFNLSAWREEAVRSLDLKPGDTVVDVGCGTGLNFPLLRQAIGPEGKLIGVDLSAAMLD